ncbi:zf-HC2 domain-containing protein [candidate division KSB1 bacterium]|nr:zf-HC2 domain-containing protein [candidate division KSB1 bacterium]
MKECPKIHLLQEALYGETSDADLARLHAHLEVCQACRDEWESQRQLVQRLVERPERTPNPQVLRLLRQSVLGRLQHRAPRASGQIFSFLNPSPALQLGFVVLLVAFGFILGRQGTSLPASSSGLNDLDALITASRAVQAQNSFIDPYLAGVERISYNPESGQIDIHYNTISDIALRGSLQDASIRLLLQKTLIETQNSAVRMDAIKAVHQIAEQEQSLDSDLLGTLGRLLFEESNPGVRLLILRVLKTLPLSEAVREMLTRIVLQEKNTALRIEAFDILTRDAQNNPETNQLLQAAQADSSSYISFRSKQLLQANTI